MATMCAYPSSKHVLPHGKYFLCCRVQCPQIYLPSPEPDHQYSNDSSTISFYISTHCMMYCACQMSFQWKETVSIVWVFYRWNCYWKTVYQKRACHNGVINCGLSSRLLHSCNSENCISPSTCIYYWDISLWKHAPRGIQELFIFKIFVVLLWLFSKCSSQIYTPD